MVKENVTKSKISNLFVAKDQVLTGDYLLKRRLHVSTSKTCEQSSYSFENYDSGRPCNGVDFSDDDDDDFSSVTCKRPKYDTISPIHVPQFPPNPLPPSSSMSAFNIQSLLNTDPVHFSSPIRTNQNPFIAERPQPSHKKCDISNIESLIETRSNEPGPTSPCVKLDISTTSGSTASSSPNSPAKTAVPPRVQQGQQQMQTNFLWYLYALSASQPMCQPDFASFLTNYTQQQQQQQNHKQVNNSISNTTTPPLVTSSECSPSSSTASSSSSKRKTKAVQETRPDDPIQTKLKRSLDMDSDDENDHTNDSTESKPSIRLSKHAKLSEPDNCGATNN
jgi:hypothetical protein